MANVLFTTEADGTHREATPEEGREHVLDLLKRGKITVKSPLVATYLGTEEEAEDKPARGRRRGASE